MNLITDVPGVRVGNAEDRRAATGVTAAIFDRSVAAGVITLGGAPGSRAVALLEPEMGGLVDAIVLSGGSIYGLDAAGGVTAVLRAQGLAYIHFALDHREHYRVAAMEPCLVPPNVDEMLHEGAFLHFMSTVQACMDAGIFPAGDTLPITLDLWTAAHGVASLLIAKPYLPWGEVDEVADRALRAAALGHAVDGLLGGDGSAESIADWITTQRHGRH